MQNMELSILKTFSQHPVPKLLNQDINCEPEKQVTVAALKLGCPTNKNEKLTVLKRRQNKQPKFKEILSKWEKMTNADFSQNSLQNKLSKHRNSSEQKTTPIRNHEKGMGDSHQKPKKKKIEISTNAQKLLMKNYFKTQCQQLSTYGGNGEEIGLNNLEKKESLSTLNVDLLENNLPNQTTAKRRQF